MVEHSRLIAALEKVRFELLAQREPGGHWVGELANSACSTATAVSALAILMRHLPAENPQHSQLGSLVMGGIHWLADQQNPDGGWGDTDRSHSNIATSMLALAAFRLTGVPAEHADLLDRAEAYVEAAGGVKGLRRRYGKDKTFAIPILTNCALAGLVPWSKVSPLPFELAALPQRFYHLLQLPVVSYAIPALVAIGQARFFHGKPWNPLVRWWRGQAVEPSLQVLEQMQPASGGFLEATPLTSFVVMSLAAIGQHDHPVTRRGAEFLIQSVRPDGSWPIDTNLATWNTSLAMNALAAAGEDVADLDCLDWLLSCQHREVHPYTGAAPGGWGWSDLSGAVPDADDTPAALLALAEIRQSESCSDHDRVRIDDAAEAGIRWLLGLQNRDGGWPTFCRGWGKLPFDRSGADLTAHAIRAFVAWKDVWSSERQRDAFPIPSRQVELAVQRGLRFLVRTQRSDGSWVPLWFGNQDRPGEENPIYGTAKVLAAYRDLGCLDAPAARRGIEWLRANQNLDGSWGSGARALRTDPRTPTGSIEETALAIEALVATPPNGPVEAAVAKGLEWLVKQVEANRFQEPSPIGFYFAKLWYYERLYPLTFTVSALGHAVHRIEERSLATSSRVPVHANGMR